MDVDVGCPVLVPFLLCPPKGPSLINKSENIIDPSGAYSTVVRMWTVQVILDLPRSMS